MSAVKGLLRAAARALAPSPTPPMGEQYPWLTRHVHDPQGCCECGDLRHCCCTCPAFEPLALDREWLHAEMERGEK